VRNLAVAGEGYLLLGRRREHFIAVEIPDAQKEPILGTCAVGSGRSAQFFDGVGRDSSSEELARIAPDDLIFLPAGAALRASLRRGRLPRRWRQYLHR
jgi:hypothetical protein